LALAMSVTRADAISRLLDIAELLIVTAELLNPGEY
jgi:hypothetical protein